MNIAIITAMFPPARTGTAFYSSNLGKSLHQIGHNVTVITVGDGDNDLLRDSLIVKRIPAVHFPVKNFFKHFRICSVLPLNYRRINKIVKESKADVILLVNHYLDIAFPAIFASLINKIPLVCSVGTQLQSCNPSRNRILNFLDRLVCGNLVLPFCSRIIAWDNEIVRYLKDIHGERFTGKIEIVNFGVNGSPETFINHEHDYSLHNQILGVGAVSEQRSFVPLVEAFAHIADEYPLLRLKIIGHIYFDAALRKAEELGIRDRVIFTGELPHEEVLSEIKKSAAYFVSLTAKYVGLGTASIETMLMGVPVIANIPPNLLGRHLLRDMEDIVLCHGLKPVEIADKFRNLLDSEQLRRSIGINGRAFVRTHLNWQKVATDMSAVMAGLFTKS